MIAYISGYCSIRTFKRTGKPKITKKYCIDRGNDELKFADRITRLKSQTDLLQFIEAYGKKITLWWESFTTFAAKLTDAIKAGMAIAPVANNKTEIDNIETMELTVMDADFIVAITPALKADAKEKPEFKELMKDVVDLHADLKQKTAYQFKVDYEEYEEYQAEGGLKPLFTNAFKFFDYDREYEFAYGVEMDGVIDTVYCYRLHLLFEKYIKLFVITKLYDIREVVDNGLSKHFGKTMTPHLMLIEPVPLNFTA